MSMAVHGTAVYLTKCDSEADKCIGQADHNMLWTDSEEAGNFSSKCEELESTDCQAGQYKNNQGGDSQTDWKRQMESDMFCVLTI